MTAEQALAKAARQLKESPQEYIAHLMQFPDKALERKLDIVREQKQMAFEQKKRESFELLTVKEELIIKVRLIKSENEPNERPERKPRQKKLSDKRAKEFQKGLENTDNSFLEEYSEDDNKQKDEPEQLFFDF